MPRTDRPLPDSLTRLLTAAQRPDAPGRARDRSAARKDRALGGAVLRVVVSATAAVVWLIVAGSILRCVLG